jgi:MerR family regulatory protein
LERAPRSTVIFNMAHTISDTAHQAGVNPDTLRYYEHLGLLAPVERMANGYRRYDSGVVDRIRFIKGAHAPGSDSATLRNCWTSATAAPAHAVTPARCWSSASATSTANSIGCGVFAVSSPTCSPASTTALNSPLAPGGARPSSSLREVSVDNQRALPVLRLPLR